MAFDRALIKRDGRDACTNFQYEADYISAILAHSDDASLPQVPKALEGSGQHFTQPEEGAKRDETEDADQTEDEWSVQDLPQSDESDSSKAATMSDSGDSDDSSTWSEYLREEESYQRCGHGDCGLRSNVEMAATPKSGSVLQEVEGRTGCSRRWYVGPRTDDPR